jgi:short subunit fatty acids transporter
VVRLARAGEGLPVRAIVNWGIAAILGALVCAAPMVVGAMFAYRPSEKLLALMRPLTIAAVFTAISNTMLGFANTFVYFSRRPDVSPSQVAMQLADTTVVPFVSFGCLAVAWLFVAVGVRRQLP